MGVPPCPTNALRFHFFVYVFDMQVPVRKRELFILSPKGLQPNYYLLAASPLNANLFTYSFLVPTDAYNHSIKYVVVLTIDSIEYTCER